INRGRSQPPCRRSSAPPLLCGRRRRQLEGTSREVREEDLEDQAFSPPRPAEATRRLSITGVRSCGRPIATTATPTSPIGVLGERRQELESAGVSARVAAFTSSAYAEDVV